MTEKWCVGVNYAGQDDKRVVVVEGTGLMDCFETASVCPGCVKLYDDAGDAVMVADFVKVWNNNFD